jgi:hypothetical protein
MKVFGFLEAPNGLDRFYQQNKCGARNPFLSMCWVDIDISVLFRLLYFILQFLRIQIASCHNTTLFLELTRTKISL